MGEITSPKTTAKDDIKQANGQKTMREMSNLDASTVKLGPDIKVRVGQQLRVMYVEVMRQGVPDRCIEILKRLDDLTDGARE